MTFKTFKGTVNEYAALHYWVAKQLGKPQHCVECGDTSERRYHWSNISGEYKRDLSDWRRLCVPCHAAADGQSTFIKAPICTHKYPLEPENTYTRPNGGKECLACKRFRHPRYMKEMRRRAWEAAGTGRPNTAPKLTAVQVINIRHAKGAASAVKLAELYHVSDQTIFQIWSGKTHPKLLPKENS